MEHPGSGEVWSLLEDWCDRAPAKLALDLGAGKGRHSLWLASRGFQVDAVERDADLAAGLRAEAGGLPVDVHQVDMLEFVPERAEYGLILGAAVLHFLLPSHLWQLSDRIVSWLTAGGLFLAEVITTADPGYQERPQDEMVEPNTYVQAGTGDIIHYFEPGELRRVFGQLDSLEYEEYRRLAPGSSAGYRAGASLVARKGMAR